MAATAMRDGRETDCVSFRTGGLCLLPVSQDWVRFAPCFRTGMVLCGLATRISSSDTTRGCSGVSQCAMEWLPITRLFWWKITVEISGLEAKAG